MAARKNYKHTVSQSEAARRYIRGIDGAVSGCGGHTATFKAASSLVWGFSLSVDQSLPLLLEWNTKCEPPWPEKDLLHKLEDALQNPRNGNPRGHLLAGRKCQSEPDRQTPVKTASKKTSKLIKRFGPAKNNALDWIDRPSSLAPDAFFAQWLSVKKGISIDALKQINCVSAQEKEQSGYSPCDVLAFGVFSPDDPDTLCGCSLYRRDGGQFAFFNGNTAKIKMVKESSAGIVGRYAAMALAAKSHKTIIKAAGIPDHLAIQSALLAVNLCDSILSFTNSSGENENPDKYSSILQPALEGTDYYIIADNDETGRKAATKWAKHGIACGAATRIVTLPTECNGHHIKDVRDYFVSGKNWADLKDLMDASTVLTEADLTAKEKKQKRVLETRRTIPTAEAFLEEYYTLDGTRTLHYLNGMWYLWENNAYSQIETAMIKSQMLKLLHDSFVQKKLGDQVFLEPFPASDNAVRDAVHAVEALALLPHNTITPHWCDTPETIPVKNRSMVVFGRTKNIDLDTMTEIPSTPKWFNYNALQYDYRPKEKNDDPYYSPHPVWDNFLKQLFPGDPESMLLLYQWIAYNMTAMTHIQKALLLIGPSRSGKGIISNVMRYCVGLGNTCSPTADSFAGPFGLETLLGKTTAIFSDVRFGTGGRNNIVVERMLNIIGEDEISIDRKNKIAFTTKLPTRITIVSNELPMLRDSSEAFANRMLILKLTNSFYDKEDMHLIEKIKPEIPAIIATALEHLPNLLETGRFVRPNSSIEDMEQLREIGSPVGKFVRERCKIGPECFEPSDNLWRSWKNFCEEEEIHNVGTKVHFFRNLLSFAPNCKKERRYDNEGNRFYCYTGISLDEF